MPAFSQTAVYLVVFFAGLLLGALCSSRKLKPAAGWLRPETEPSEDGKACCSGQASDSHTVDSPPQADSSNDAARELAKLRERYELVTTNIAASVIIYDIDGKVVFCSPYTQVLTGYTPAEIEAYSENGADFFESVVLDKDLERYQRARHVSQLGEDILVRCRIRHRSGLKLWLETRMVPVCDENGEVVSVLAVTVDVTDTLTYQEQIEAHNRDLSDFAYMVSHDLKAPVFTIKGMASALLEDHEEQLGSSGRELVDYIIDATGRLEQLISSVIEYSSISTKEWHEADVDLNTVINNVRADLAELIRTKQAVLHVQSDLPTVRGDQIRVYQIFSNLLGNALKYSSAERIPEIHIKAKRTSTDIITAEMQDNGLGIPAAKLGEIFRPYRRAHGGNIEGSGIGLACVKKIVDRLGGTVSVASIEHQGSTFTVTLPAAQPNPREIPEDLARLF
jgi:PAS domain S-box-containing protein